MKVAVYHVAQLAFQLAFFSVSALALQDPGPTGQTDDLTAVLRQRQSTEEPEAIDRHEMTVSVSTLKVPGKAWKLYEKGIEAEKREDFDTALTNFQAALKVYPDFAAALEQLGTTLLWQRKWAEAKAAFHKAIALDPESFHAELGLGLLLDASGHFEEAINHLERALYLNGECWQVRYALGRAHYGLGSYSQAEQNLKLASAWRPKHPNVYLLLALVLSIEDKPSDALAEMQTFLTVSPDDPLAPAVRAKIRELSPEKGE